MTDAHHALNGWAWDLRRLMRALYRRFGALAWIAPAAAVVVAAALGLELIQWQVQNAVRREIGRRESQVEAPVESAVARGRARLVAFDRLLPPEEDIPDIIGSMLSRAEQSGLTISRGEYRAEADAAGGFMRFHLSLPIKGDASTIVRFMQTTMREHRSLALESVRLTRQRPDSKELEVRVDWTLLASARVMGGLSRGALHETPPKGGAGK